MTIDEAIAKERKKADLHRFNSCHIDAELCADDTEAIEDAKNRCIKCAEEHEQLAEWLEELKDYRENQHRSLRHMYEKGYNKAIDDFVEAIDRADREEPLILDMYEIEHMAEQLKAGGKNE